MRFAGLLVWVSHSVDFVGSGVWVVMGFGCLQVLILLVVVVLVGGPVNLLLDFLYKC